MRGTELSIWLHSYFHWQIEGYDMALRSSYVDDSTGFTAWNGMRTEQLALWLIERKEECVENLVLLSVSLGIDILSILNDRNQLSSFIDISSLTDGHIKALKKEVVDYQKRFKYRNRTRDL